MYFCTTIIFFSPLRRSIAMSQAFLPSSPVKNGKNQHCMNAGGEFTDLTPKLKSAYLMYLEMRIGGLDASTAIAEVNSHVSESCCKGCRPLKLQSLWDILNLRTPPSGIAASYSSHISASAWQQHSALTLEGDNISSCFSGVDRLILIDDMIRR